MLTAVVGINWGDEGKGRMVDLLSAKYNVICRYQGGNNAGHTVVNDKGRFILNLLPSGILRDNVVNVMGNGMVIDLEHLCGEINALKSKGVKISPDTLKISDKAFICMPWHKQQDILEEERLADKKYGSTRRGIAPVYGDKVMKKGIRMGDLLTRDTLEKKVAGVREWKRLILGGYGEGNNSLESMMQWLIEFGKPLLPYICDISEYLLGRSMRAEIFCLKLNSGHCGILTMAYILHHILSNIGGIRTYRCRDPWVKLDQVIGIMKAYSSCVGEGPFTAELFGEEASRLREAGAEYGAATGRPRRVGGFDIPASRYGFMSGGQYFALTKLDVLSYLDIIPVCIAYEIDGVRCDHFPTGDRLLRAKPIYEYLDGFRTDISKCRKPDDLPVAAIRYIRFIEKAVGCPIQYVSVGAGRMTTLK